MVKGNRSPRYPVMGLGSAVEYLETLYKELRNVPADRDTIVQKLGYKSRNGHTDAILATLGYYGLLEDAGNRRLKISSNGFDIVRGERGDSERATAIREAALVPELFAEIADQFGTDGFSNRNLENYLIKQLNFNANTVGKAVKAYRDTMEFVRLETFGVDLEPRREHQEDSVQAQPLQFNSLGGRIPPPYIPLSLPQGDEGDFQYPTFRHHFSSDNTDVSIIFTGEVTLAKIAAVKKVMEIAEAELRAETQPSVQPPLLPEYGLPGESWPTPSVSVQRTGTTERPIPREGQRSLTD